MKLIRSLDFFTKPKEEVDSSTGVGGLFSIIGFTCGLLFFIIEVSSFLGSTWIREMSVDNDYMTRKERVNIDVTFFKAPCALLSLTQEEEGSNPTFDIPLTKERYTSQGELIGKYTEDPNQDQIKVIGDAIDSGEYCRMYGNFSILEVPGNFHFGFRTKRREYSQLSVEQIKKVSIDIVLNHFTFGTDTNHKTIYKKFGISNNFSPYDSLAVINGKPNERINFFVKLVPNYYYFKENAKTGMLAYQFSLTHQKIETTHIDHYVNQVRWGQVEPPTFRINYEFSPITINYRLKNNSFAGFLVNTLAIVGGIFSIMGMINSFVLTKYKHLRN